MASVNPWLLGLLALSAFIPCAVAAQDGPAGDPPVEMSGATTGATRDASPLHASDVNPMTGTPLAVEALRRRLAEAQVQARLEVELTNIERARSERRRLAQPDGPVPAPALPTLPAMPTLPAGTPGASVAHVAARSKRPVAARAELDGAASRAPLPSPAAPRLVGVIRGGGNAVALVESDGRTLAIEAGHAQAGVAVQSVGADSALVNQRPLKMSGAGHRIALPQVSSPATPSPTAGPAVSPTAATSPFPGLNLGEGPSRSPAPGDLPAAEVPRDPASSRP